MLRITRLERSGRWITVVVEGRVAGEWIPVLDGECRKLLDMGANVALDLHGVSFVDGQGVACLCALLASGSEQCGISIFNETAFVRERIAGARER